MTKFSSLEGTVLHMQQSVNSLTAAMFSKQSKVTGVINNNSTVDAVGGAVGSASISNQNELNQVTAPPSHAWKDYTTTSETEDETSNGEKWVLAGRRSKRRRLRSNFGSLPSQFQQEESVNSPATGL